MNKPIINGIDVSECNFCLEREGKQKCATGFGVICDCENLYNCYFKQLKRLQEENKELRQIRKNSPDIQEPYVYLYRQIKKQCYKLEEENKRSQMLSCANCGEKYLSPEGAELYEKNVQLQEENEKIKKQYNCYACGNCEGKEDYINLEKHHKGLRKQFDELVKRNNTLSLRIEELEKENEELKERLKNQCI